MSNLLETELAVDRIAAEVRGRMRLAGAPGEKQDTRWITGVRGIAALTVVVTHCFIEPLQGDWSPWYTPIFSFLGAVAVAVFIFLSGYCLGLPCVSTLRLKSFKSYLERRANRIFPAYWAALAFAILVAVFVTHQITKWDVTGMTPHVLWPVFLLHDWLGGSPEYDGPMWTLPVEFHAYFAMPFILWLMRRFTPVKGIVTWCVGILIASHWLPGSLHLWAVFGLGIFAAWALNTEQKDMPSPKFLGGVAACAFALTVGLYVTAGMLTADNRTWLSVLWAIIAACGFAWIMSADGIRVREFLGTGKPYKLGEQSYSLYLIHCPIILALTHFILPRLGIVADSFLMVIFAIPLALIFSRGFWWIFERPNLERKSKAKTHPNDLLNSIRPAESVSS